MEFEDAPTITDRDRQLADAPRLQLEPVHQAVAAERVIAKDPSMIEAETGFGFDQETTISSMKELPSDGVSPTPHHHTALIAALSVCAVFVGVIIFYQLNR